MCPPCKQHSAAWSFSSRTGPESASRLASHRDDMQLRCTADTPGESLVHGHCEEAGEAVLKGEGRSRADTPVPCHQHLTQHRPPDAAQVGAVTSAPAKGLDKVRSAAHKMHLGNHSNEPCQLLLRVSPQGCCTPSPCGLSSLLWALACPPRPTWVVLCSCGVCWADTALWVPTS